MLWCRAASRTCLQVFELIVGSHEPGNHEPGAIGLSSH